jgi:hypothetical protein
MHPVAHEAVIQLKLLDCFNADDKHTFCGVPSSMQHPTAAGGMLSSRDRMLHSPRFIQEQTNIYHPFRRSNLLVSFTFMEQFI